MTTSRIFHRPGQPPLAVAIALSNAGIAAALEEGTNSSRLVLARKHVAAARQQREAARAEFDAARVANTNANTPSGAMAVAARKVEALDNTVQEARMRLAGAVSAASPPLAAGLQPHLVVTGGLIEELLSLLETCLDPLAHARRLLVDLKVDAVPRLIAGAPLVVQHLREMRQIIGGN